MAVCAGGTTCGLSGITSDRRHPNRRSPFEATVQFRRGERTIFCTVHVPSCLGSGDPTPLEADGRLRVVPQPIADAVRGVVVHFVGDILFVVLQFAR